MPKQSDPDLVTASLALLVPDEPVPVRLMNTIWADRYGVHDALETVGNLRAWLAAVHPDEEAGFAPRSGDLQRFRALRDALRRVAAQITDDQRPRATSVTMNLRAAVAEVNRSATQAPTWPQLTYKHGQLRLTPTGRVAPVQRAMSSIARDAMELVAGAERVELRACQAPGCVLYFVKDHPRREWCSVACGNRVRAARHYQRHH